VSSKAASTRSPSMPQHRAKARRDVYGRMGDGFAAAVRDRNSGKTLEEGQGLRFV